MATRNNLCRLRVFVWIIGVVGVAQAAGAVVAAMSVDNPAPAGAQLAVAVGVALVGASTVAARTRFVRRPWRIDDPTSVAIDYASRVMVQVILALGAANIAFAAAIITGAPWIVAIGLVFFVAPLSAVVPTARNIGRAQTELDSQGCPFSLVESLQPRDTV